MFRALLRKRILPYSEGDNYIRYINLVAVKDSFERNILSMFVILKSCFWPTKSARSRRKCIKCTFMIFLYFLSSTNIASNTFFSSETLLSFVQPLFVPLLLIVFT